MMTDWNAFRIRSPRFPVTGRNAGNEKAAPGGALYRPVAFGIAVVIGAWALSLMWSLAQTDWARAYAFGQGDLAGYLDGARRFLETGSPYAPEQLVPWTLGAHSFIHPPVALALFLPFLVLPSILWWAIPILGTAYLMASARPAPWTWPLIALCLAWPRSAGAILTGNTDLWAMFAVALGVRFRWPAVLLAIKPTFAPLALIGVRDRRTWIAAAILGLAMLPLLPLWLQYATVIRGANLPLWYSLLNLPLVALPVLAWRR